MSASVEPLSYEAAVAAVRKTTANLRELERTLAEAIVEAADAEGVYRWALSAELRTRRSEGLSQDEAMVHARADVAVQLRDHRRADARLAALHEQLADRRGERDSLHLLIEWSKEARS